MTHKELDLPSCEDVVSALACFFLRYGIDQVKAGALKIPIKPMGAVIADGRAYE